MGATLDALHRLQAIEHQLRSVRGQIASRSSKVNGQRKRLAAAEQAIAASQDSIRKAQSEADALELERKSHEAHIARLRDALNQSKSNKDYAAILTQLNTDKADAAKLEDRVLEILGRVDEQRKKSAELRASVDHERKRLAEVEAAAQEYQQRIAGQIQGFEAQREEAAAVIGPENLNIFERACGRHDGEAMATVERVHPRSTEYICTGCHMSVPLERINALQSRDDVQQCPSCLRILCLEMPAGAHV